MGNKKGATNCAALPYVVLCLKRATPAFPKTGANNRPETQRVSYIPSLFLIAVLQSKHDAVDLVIIVDVYDSGRTGH
jgi:hypothetical protein